jgi:hypothetical protein
MAGKTTKSGDVNTSIEGMDIEIEGNHVSIEFDLARPYASKSGKRNLRFSSRGRQRIPGAANDLVIMLNMDERV